MFPTGVRTDALISLPASATASIGGALPRPLAVAVGSILLTGVLGLLLLVGAPSTTRAIRDDCLDRPDRSFAVGFLGFFGLLVGGTAPLFVSTYATHPAADAIAAVVSIPTLLLWAVLLAVGGAVGALVLGDRIASRLGDDSPSSPRALAIGAVILGSSQLLPVVGIVVAMGLATLAIGATVRGRTEIDGWLFETQTADTDPHGVWESAEESAGSVSEADRPSSVTPADSIEAGFDPRRSDDDRRDIDTGGQYGTDLEATGNGDEFDVTGNDDGLEETNDDGLKMTESEDGWTLDWEGEIEPEHERDGESRTESDGE